MSSTATSTTATTATSSSSATTRTSDCRKFSPNIFNKSKCSHCFRQREEHSAAALECNRASRKVSKCGYLFVAPDWDFSNPLYRTKKLAILQTLDNTQAITKLQAFNPRTQINVWKFSSNAKRNEIKSYIDEVIRKLGYIDLLINGLTLCKEQDIAATIQVNLTTPINIINLVLPFMDKSKEAGRGGMIVNLSSVTGLDPSPVFCVYSAAKFGLMGFTRSLAHPIYYDRTGVAVLGICCGPTKTFVRHTMKAFLEYGQDYVDKLKGAPCQETAVCARNIVRAIEMGSNGQIWMADNERLDIVKPQLYWKMSNELQEYMEH